MPGAAGTRTGGRWVKARELLGTLLAPGTFRSWDEAPADVRPDPAYAAAWPRRGTGPAWTNR